MDRNPDSTPSPPDGSTADRLDSWKEISTYLRRDVSTVQRWEKREGMPVHRHLHDKQGSVYAFRPELDAWAASRRPSPEVEEVIPAQAPAPPPAERGRRIPVVPIVVLALVAALAAAGVWGVRRNDYFWRNPLADARFERVVDLDGPAHAASISRDGRLVAFVASRGGQVDLWIAQTGAGPARNITAGRLPELVNPSVRTIEFSPDGSLVSFWAAKSDAANRRQIGIWAAPTLVGDPRPLLDGAAEVAWSRDGQRLVYHTPAAGDPMFLKTDGVTTGPIFTAPAPQHSHFPTWSPDQSFIYFVQGNLPNQLDVWRIRPDGGAPERVTFHGTRVTHPTLLDDSTLLYLATSDDGSGPWIYGMDVDRRVPHRLSFGTDRYTSLAASADGRRLIATASRSRTSLWRAPLASGLAVDAAIAPIALPTAQGRLPRLSASGLLYVSSNGTADSIWRIAGGTPTELWTAPAAHVLGGPAIAPDGRRIAFTVEEHGRTRLVMMGADGMAARTVADAVRPQGEPAWSPDGRSIVVAAIEAGRPCLYRVSPDEPAVTRLIDDDAHGPAWAPDGTFIVYSGTDIGTTFPVKAVTAAGRPHSLPGFTLSRGARRFRFVPGRSSLVVLRGDIEHKNLWAIDLATGAERQLTNFGRDVVIGDFDLSPDGREIVFERVQDASDVVLIER